MLDIESIEITNFRSFRGTHTFKFPDTPGLYYVTGRNLIDTQLGANGVGKSSFLDAIVWCLEGKTARGLRASEVISWGADTCKVVCTLIVAKRRHVISRSQSPNELLLDDEIVDQTRIDGLLRLNHRSLLHSVIFPQFGSAFFDLSPSIKLSYFSDIMNLQAWNDRAALADSLAKDYEKSVQKLEANHDGKRQRLDGLLSEIKSLKQKESDFIRNNTTQIAGLTAEAVQLEKKVSSLTADIDGFDETDGQTNLLSDRLKSAKKQHEQYRNESMKLDHARTDAVKRQKAASSHATKLAEGRVCPICGDRLEKSTFKSLTNKAESELALCNDEVREATHNHELAVDKERKSGLEALKLEKLLIEANQKNQVHRNEMQKSEVARAETVSRLEGVRKHIKELTDATNPYSVMIDEKRAERTACKADLDKLNALLAEERRLAAAVSYWPKGFKQIRLMVIEETIKGLELETNNSLVALGLVDWNVTLAVERENKSEGVTREFSVFVQGPDHEAPVRFQTYSGGEIQRLRLAGDLALANLIMEQAGLDNLIEFFDEPSAHLSQEGLNDLVEVLHDRALTRKKRIFIVDHTIYPGELFAGVMTIVKSPEGSTIGFS